MKIYPSHHLCSLHRTIATQRKRCCARPLLSSYYSHSQRPSGELPTPKESETKTQSKPSSSNESPESSSPQASKDSTSPDPPPSPKNSTTDRDFIPIQPSSSQREITRLNQDHQQFAPPPPSATRFQKDLHSLIETFKYEWRGANLLLGPHRQQVAEIKERIIEGGMPMSRWEFRFYNNHINDMFRIRRMGILLSTIPFSHLIVGVQAIIVDIIVGTLILGMPRGFPSTMLLPDQQKALESMTRKRRDKMVASMREAYRKGKGAGDMDEDEWSLAICDLLGLPRVWGSRSRFFIIERRLKLIAEDDKLLRREGLGSMLTEEELRDALHERGMTTDHLSAAECLEKLQLWLKTIDGEDVKDDPISRRLLAVGQGGFTQQG